MNIVVHDYCGHPFQVDLSRELARRGHKVHHLYTSISGGPKGQLTSDGNLTVMDLGKDDPPVDKNSLFKRRQQEYAYGKKLIDTVKTIAPDIVISANTPLEAQKQISKWSHDNNVKFIFWLQDIISIAAGKLLKKKSKLLAPLVGFYFTSIEKKLLLKSDHIVTISDDFTDILSDWGISKQNVSTIPNWSPIEEIPMYPKKNEFSTEKGITDTFNIVYSGTLGMKHNPQFISNAAKELKDIPNIRFIVISEGVGMDFLKKAKQDEKLDNLTLLSFQPFELFPQVLASADLLLTLLEKDAGIFSVPSKVWSGYCSGRAGVLLVPKENLASKITERVNAGFTLPPEEASKLSQIIREAYNAPEQLAEMGSNARQYAEQNFKIKTIVTKFEHIFNSISK